MKKKTFELISPNRLIDDLELFIENRYSDVLRITNHVMVKLFWKVGTAFNDCSEEKVKHSEVAEAVSTCLANQFGPLLNVYNVNLMIEFASKCSENMASNIASFISWAHITELLILDDPIKWIFYARLALQNQLSPIELRGKILENSFEQSQPFKLKFPDHPFFDLKPLHGKGGVFTIKKFLQNPLADYFRLLLEPRRQNESWMISSHNLSVLEKELVEKISLYIEEMQSYLNFSHNGQFNIFSHEIGRKIIEYIESTNLVNEHQDELIQELASLLEKEHGKNFSKEQLMQRVKFAEQVKEGRILVQFAELIRWEHIVALSKVTKLNEKVFYARLAAIKDWSSEHLETQIESKLYEQTMEVVKNIPIESDLTKNQFLEKFRIEIKVLNMALTDYIRDLGEEVKRSQLLVNMYKNEYFLDFISVQEHNYST